MTLLIDINVVLDTVLNRQPWEPESTALLDAVQRGRAKGWVAGHTVTTLHYIVARQRDRSVAATAVA